MQLAKESTKELVKKSAKKSALDFNHRPTLSEEISTLIDKALTKENEQQTPRDYLGASRLGVSCNRALQFEYTKTQKDEGQNFTGKILRIFEAGHVFEDLAIKWLRDAGFELVTEKTSSTGDKVQFGFSVANGKIKGHIDGVITSAPNELNLKFPMQFPALWECKSMNNKSFKDTVKKGLTTSKPIYASQIAIYQAYMESSIPDISKNPALFTAINKDTAEIHFELIPFDKSLAQSLSDKAVKILTATDAGELLPRISNDSSYFECRFCPWSVRCFNLKF
jgi:hypothetical protein